MNLTLKKYHGNYYDLLLPDGTLAGRRLSSFAPSDPSAALGYGG